MPIIRRRDENENVVFVRDAVQAFLSSADVKRLGQNTQEEYRYNLSQFADWCATHALVQNRKNSTWTLTKVRESYNSICLHKINAEVVQFFLDHLQIVRKPQKGKASLSSHTLAQVVKGIKRLLNWCLEDEIYSKHIQATTLKHIKKPRMEKLVYEVFSPDDIELLLQACDKERNDHLKMRDKAIVLLLLDTGVRATELCTLTMNNIDLDPKDAHIKVFGKGKKWGEIGMGETTRRSIQKYIRTYREPTIEHEISSQLRRASDRQAQQIKRQSLEQSRVFVNRSGKRLTRNGLLQLIERLGERAGIQGVRCSPHTFRHTFSVMFMRNGGDIHVLSSLLRHSSLTVTQEYLKALTQAEIRRKAQSVVDNL